MAFSDVLTPTPRPTGGPTFACPGCGALLATTAPGATLCPRCNWTGEVYHFNPRQITADSAEAALPEDATCMHHPSKKATAVCAGTGDYICSLCAVDIEGQTFSAEYLNSAGNKKARKAFNRMLPRPDKFVYTYLIFLFVPYVNFILIPFAFLWIPHGFILYRRALKMRDEDPLFARLMSRWDVVAIPLLLTLVAIGWVIGAVAIGMAISESRYGR